MEGYSKYFENDARILIVVNTKLIQSYFSIQWISADYGYSDVGNNVILKVLKNIRDPRLCVKEALVFQDPSIFTTPAIDLWNEGKPISGKKCFLWLKFGKGLWMISCWKSNNIYWIWLSNPDLLDVLEWKNKVVLNCFRKFKSYSFKVDLPLHSTEIGFGRGRLDVKSNWIYVLFSKD